MFCPNCGKQLPDDSVFCDACGTALAASQSAPQGVPQQPVQQPMQQPVQQPAQYQPQAQQQYQPQVQPPYQPAYPGQKKGKTGLIAGIALVAVAAVLAVVLLPRLLADRDDAATEDKPASETREDKPSGGSHKPDDNKPGDDKPDGDKPDVSVITPTPPEPTPPPEPEAWIDGQKLRIARLKPFSFQTAINDGEKDFEVIDVACEVKIEESTEDVPEGFKRVTASFTDDVSASLGKGGGTLADGVFDRYTGTVLEFEDGVPKSAQSPDRDGYARIEFGDRAWDISRLTLMDSDLDDEGRLFVYKSISVICPVDYDGAVFYVGYDDMKLSATYEKLDFSKKLYTFDRLPYLDSGYAYYYFTYSGR